MWGSEGLARSGYSYWRGGGQVFLGDALAAPEVGGLGFRGWREVCGLAGV